MVLKHKSLLAAVGPGILVAATGVGAGDLATAAFTGNHLGLAVLWAVLVGSLFKYVLNEGLARWQLATGDTLLEGCVKHLGRPFKALFLLYFVVWSFLVGVALLSACGVTMHAMLPLISAERDKLVYGMLHSGVAAVLVYFGGYRVFEKVMTVCVGVMFSVVVVTAVALKPPLGDIVHGMFVPSIPRWNSGGLEWTVALLGGVGGTLTILAYGYWIREEGRENANDLALCRIDLLTGYAMTALFGMSMLVIGTRMEPMERGGATLLVKLAESLQEPFGSLGGVMKVAFLLGAWGAVFSSLLGVWQSLPYMFADFWLMTQSKNHTARPQVNDRSRAYLGYLLLLSTVPVVGVFAMPFAVAQQTYALVGALVIPALAAILLYLNNHTKLVSAEFRNRAITNLVLVIALLFFIYAGWLGIRK